MAGHIDPVVDRGERPARGNVRRWRRRAGGGARDRRPRWAASPDARVVVRRDDRRSRRLAEHEPFDAGVVVDEVELPRRRREKQAWALASWTSRRGGGRRRSSAVADGSRLTHCSRAVTESPSRRASPLTASDELIRQQVHDELRPAVGRGGRARTSVQPSDTHGFPSVADSTRPATLRPMGNRRQTSHAAATCGPRSSRSRAALIGPIP